MPYLLLTTLQINKVMQKEAKARIKINELLQNAGWRLFDDKKGKANIVLENNARKKIDNDYPKIEKESENHS